MHLNKSIYEDGKKNGRIMQKKTSELKAVASQRECISIEESDHQEDTAFLNVCAPSDMASNYTK